MSTLFWSSPGESMAGVGGVTTFNAGSGPDRYRKALKGLRATGRDIGLVSFPFDTAEPVSVVYVPARVDRRWVPQQGPTAPAIVVDDGREVWENGFDLAMDALASGRVEKVVLARRVLLDAGPTWPEPVLANLMADNPTSYVFSINGLIGASPELLVRVKDNRVTSLVLAGTATTPEGLDNDKTTDEHDHASRSVEARLRTMTDDLSSRRSVRRFGAINHVATLFEATTRPGVGVLDLAAVLHPTAAVGGTPTATAVELIGEIEPWSRGGYAGPVGWFDTEGNGEFAVALRCARMVPAPVTLYAGGGLVVGSERESEWEETGLKLRPMLTALGLPQG